MSKQFPIGWCEAAGKAAGEAERGGGPTEAITARRPGNWKPWKVRTQAQQQERCKASGIDGARATKLSRKLDQHLGAPDAEGEE